MDHKQEIIETRSLGFGSSDAKMVASVGKIGQLNETARKRIAEMLEYIKEGNLRSYNIPNMRINVFFALYSYLQVGYGLGILGDLNMRGLNNVWPDPKTYKELGIDKLMVEKAVDHKQFLMSLRNESLSKQIS